MNTLPTAVENIVKDYVEQMTVVNKRQLVMDEINDITYEIIEECISERIYREMKIRYDTNMYELLVEMFDDTIYGLEYDHDVYGVLLHKELLLHSFDPGYRSITYHDLEHEI